MIQAGTKEQVVWGDGNWAFLDIGFSHNQKSCGLLIGNEEPRELHFGDAKQEILQYIHSSISSVNLVIEAPLSVCFKTNGNPSGRKMEKQGSKTRYWYTGLGCIVMTAAMYIVRDIGEYCKQADVKLFEGFVTFKESGKKTNHSADVLALRKVVRENESKVYKPEPQDSGGIVQSAFPQIYNGIPVIIEP